MIAVVSGLDDNCVAKEGVSGVGFGYSIDLLSLDYPMVYDDEVVLDDVEEAELSAAEVDAQVEEEIAAGARGEFAYAMALRDLPWWDPRRDAAGAPVEPLKAKVVEDGQRLVPVPEFDGDGKPTGRDLLMVSFNEQVLVFRGTSEHVEYPTGEQVKGHLHTLARAFRDVGAKSPFVVLGMDAAEEGMLVLYNPADNVSQRGVFWQMREAEHHYENAGVRSINLAALRW